MTEQTAPSMDPGFNPGHWLHDIENAGSKAIHGVEDAATKAKDDALSAITDAQKAATDAITKAGNAELDELHAALKELDDVKAKIAQAEHDITDIAAKAVEQVFEKLESAAAAVAQNALNSVCHLIDEAQANGINGPKFELQLGVVSVILDNPIDDLAKLKAAAADGIKGYSEILDVVSAVAPDSVKLAFSAEIEFVVVSSNALEAGVSVTIDTQDLATMLKLFLDRIKLL